MELGKRKAIVVVNFRTIQSWFHTGNHLTGNPKQASYSKTSTFPPFTMQMEDAACAASTEVGCQPHLAKKVAACFVILVLCTGAPTSIDPKRVSEANRWLYSSAERNCSSCSMFKAFKL